MPSTFGLWYSVDYSTHATRKMAHDDVKLGIVWRAYRLPSTTGLKKRSIRPAVMKYCKKCFRTVYILDAVDNEQMPLYHYLNEQIWSSPFPRSFKNHLALQAQVKFEYENLTTSFLLKHYLA